ncbi:hypothetical protein OAK75_01865 [Bacteriovoracales bacterium]|nr:hypothetical protein [Bacteriovoracales bacterium]
MDIPSKDFDSPTAGNCALKIEDEKVEMTSLSKLTGFPIDYIKKELVLDQEEVTMTQLREQMMVFLNSNFEDIFKDVED